MSKDVFNGKERGGISLAVAYRVVRVSAQICCHIHQIGSCSSVVMCLTHLPERSFRLNYTCSTFSHHGTFHQSLSASSGLISGSDLTLLAT